LAVIKKTNDMKKYFYSEGKEKHGPLSLEELKQENISKETLIWFEGLDDWKPAEELDEMKPILELQPPPILIEEKNESSEPEGKRVKPTEYNSEQLGKYKGVGGWLLLLCFALTINSPLRTLYNLSTSYYETSLYFEEFPGLQNLLYIDGFLSVLLMVFSIRAGIALWSIKPGAVKIAKNYFLIFLGYSVIAVFLPFTAGLPSEANDAMIPEVAKGTIQSLFFFGIWYSYLNVSKRVKATYISYSISEE